MLKWGIYFINNEAYNNHDSTFQTVILKYCHGKKGHIKARPTSEITKLQQIQRRLLKQDKYKSNCHVLQ
jgi:hypothetical protein